MAITGTRYTYLTRQYRLSWSFDGRDVRPSDLTHSPCRRGVTAICALPTAGVDVKWSLRIAALGGALGLECRVIAGTPSSVHVMISPNLAIGNATSLVYVRIRAGNRHAKRETVPISLAVQTRLSWSIGLPRVLDMKGLTDTPRRTHHRSNLPDALRAAARAMLDEAGPDVVGLQETARRVGVSARAAYRHFANKEGLLASVAAEGFRELAAAMDTSASGRDPLGGIGLAYFDFALRKRGLFGLMFGPILVERAKYPELNEAASAVFGLLQHVAVRADEWTGRRRCGGDGPGYGQSFLIIDGLL